MKRGKPLKRRSAIKRGKPPTPTTAPSRKARLQPVNRKRRERRKAAGEVYGPYHQFVATLPCLLRRDGRHTCRGKVRGHHLQHVGNGGKDEGNEVPLCDGAHTLSKLSVHNMGADSFQAYWSVNLNREAMRAARLWAEWQDMQAEAAA